MIDLNTSLTIIINYRMYPTLFRRKEQTWKRSIRDIIETALTQRKMNALWMLLLLQLASICSDSRFRGLGNGEDQTLLRS